MNLCGSKTDKCPDCEEWVKRADKLTHKSEGWCQVFEEDLKEKQAKET